MTMNVVRDGESQLIDRFIIVHLGLLPGGHANDGGFDEAASLEELSEYILYYYDRTSYNTHPDLEDARCSPSIENRCTYNNHEAIRFAGLCHALYTFPTSLNNDGINRNQKGEGGGGNPNFAEEVQLTTCTLIFIPLEDCQTKGLFAVAQFPKKNPNSDSRGDIVVSPSLLREYVCISHKLFEMTKCGIHRCLTSFDPKQLPPSLTLAEYHRANFELCSNAYPGMEELYKKHVQLRKLTEKSEIAADREVHYRGMEKTMKIIEEMYFFLPITFLRKDLKDFYDWILNEWNSCSSTDQVVFKVLPPPTLTQPKNKGEFFEKTKCVISKFQSIISNGGINGKISTNTNYSFKHPIGFSTFYDGHHICTHTKSTLDLSPLQTRLIHRYLSTGTTVDNITKTKKSIHDDETENGCYISPPSKGALLRYGEVMEVPHFGRVWSPRIFISDTIPIKVVMYKQGVSQFIFYLNCLGEFTHHKNEKHSSNDSYPISQSLIDLSLLIDKEMEVTNVSLSDNVSKLECHLYQGLQIISIDRRNDNCLCLVDKYEEKPITKNHFFQFPFFKDNTIENKEYDSKTISDIFRTLSLEIPREITSSFECIHEKDSETIAINSKGYELCSYLPKNKKWLFSIQDEKKNRELYILLSENVYFSLKQVLQKVHQVSLDLDPLSPI